MAFERVMPARVLLILVLAHGYASEGKKRWLGYFPERVFDSNPTLDRSKAEWYGGALADLGETSLFMNLKEKGQAHVYRLLWLRSFHSPASVRVVINANGTASIIAKFFVESGPISQGKLLEREAQLNISEVETIASEVNAAGFWQLTTESPESKAKPLPGGSMRVAPPQADGTRWIMEGVKNGSYHVVDRWSPPRNNRYLVLCTHLLHLAGIDE